VGESQGWSFEPSFNRPVKVQTSDDRLRAAARGLRNPVGTAAAARPPHGNAPPVAARPVGAARPTTSMAALGEGRLCAVMCRYRVLAAEKRPFDECDPCGVRLMGQVNKSGADASYFARGWAFS
jgi:hypothetical protein